MLVPIMFGSVVFKELIENNVRMTNHLRETFRTQRSMIRRLDRVSDELGTLSENLFDKSYDSWGRLTSIRDQARDYENPELERSIRLHSRDIEEIAGLTERLRSLIENLNDKTARLNKSSEQIRYIDVENEEAGS